MQRSWAPPCRLATAAAVLFSLGCGDGTGPSAPPAFTTSTSSYTLQVVNEIPQVVIPYTFQNDGAELAALQGCSGNAGVAWWLEKQVSGGWKQAYPALCEPNPDSGVPVAAGGQYSATVTIRDGEPGSPTARISERPVAGTYRLRFGLFERVNLQTGVGFRVTDGRQYSNTFTLQD